MKYKLAIFDFDGTLADSFPWVLNVMDQLADRHHFPHVNREEVDLLRSLGVRQMLSRHKIPLWRVPFIARDVRRLMNRDVQQIPLFPGIDDTLRILSENGVQLALVTSNSFENSRHVLGAHNMQRFHYHECSVSIFGKAGRMKKIIKHSRLAPQEIISIGDEIRDIEAARKLNISAGAVAWGYTQVDTLQAQSPALVFHAVADIVPSIL